VVTVDAAATVGDVARHLLLADPRSTQGAAVPAAEDVTLGVSNLALDPRQPLADSGLRSGTVVTLSRAGATHGDPSRDAAAVLTIQAGPDKGKEFGLARGTSVLGRERGVDVRLSDDLVSRRHARINVGDVVEVIDLGSANGVQIDGLAVPRSILRSDDMVQVGDSQFTVRLVKASATAEATATGHIRSPRLDPVYEGEEFEAPELPERPGARRFPLVALIAPILMGGLLYAITKNPVSIAFVALSPLMMVGNVVEGRLEGRSAYKKAVADLRAEADELCREMAEAGEREVAARNGEHPATSACLAAGRDRSPLLWTRRPGERGFVELRLGSGVLPSRSTLELPSTKKATRALHKELVEQTAPLRSVGPVPVVGVLGDSAIGVGGPRDLAIPVARALVVQLAALHSPAELVVAAVTSSTSAPTWDWLKWLPHTTSPVSPIANRSLASSSTVATTLVAELEDLLDQRAAKGTESADPMPAVLLLVEGDAPVEHARLVQLAEQGARGGIYVLWVAAEVASLPAACRAYVALSRDGVHGSVGYVHDGTEVTPVQVEAATESEVAAFTRAMSPLVDVGARGLDDSDLPRSVSLLTLVGTELASAPEVVIERWSENRSIVTGPLAPPSPPKHVGSLRSVIGEAAGQRFALDLRVDGPHALVGGTTGAGKSELLRSWILAMAVAHSPQRLTFLLVDYKGGSAFEECRYLPHTVGLVTDLSQYLVRRALTSLSAEVKYREELLHRHRVGDLVELERRGVAEAPPSLVIVVDEFAALVNEVPEFVDGVVNVAQRGRSLGLHLILATQQPSGVIKGNLRANTNLRLALRMADEADSTDVLGSPEAAFFDPALRGRAVSKTGPGRLVPFQVGYSGGWTTDEPPAPQVTVEELGFGAGLEWILPEADEVAADPGPKDIQRLVGSIKQAATIAEIDEPRKPWLPELKNTYDLAKRDEVPNRRTDTELVFGVLDDPDNQAQPVVAFLPDREGNLAVYGTGGSGKSTLLRTIAISAGFTIHGGPSHVYGIDFGARGLAMLEDLPHVGSIISGSDHERITRLLEWLRGLIDERALAYSKVAAATITDYRRLANAPDETRILMLVDGMSAFRQAYEVGERMRWAEMLTSIAADGRQVGVHLIVSSDQRTGVNAALASAIQSRVVLRMATSDDYGLLGVPYDVLGPLAPPGRGLIGEAEVQVASLGGTTDVVRQAAAVHAFGDSMRKSGVVPAAPIKALSDRVLLNDLPYAAEGRPTVGLSSASLAPIGFDATGAFLVSGPPLSGRTSTLLTLATSLRRWSPGLDLYYFGPARSPLARLAIWTQSATGDRIVDTAQAVAQQISSRLSDTPAAAVFIEDVASFANGPTDSALSELVKTCLAMDSLVVAEGESSTLGGGAGLVGLVKRDRAGLALQPDQGDGAIYRTNFPRVNRNAFPPGRALLVHAGRAETVQIGLYEGGDG
jgi:S-DNA-T family DNA segregation ATPase FtsK/SpoIIIE